MSATGRNKTPRRDADGYQTPIELARRLVELLQRDGWCFDGGSVLEPSAGTGAFVTAVKENTDADVTYIHANDIVYVPGPPASVEHSVDVWSAGPFEDFTEDGWSLILGNPPYSQAEQHIRHGLKLLAPGGVLAFLLRLAFLESAERIPFWRAHPAAAVYVLSERPSFTGGGTDSTAYGLFVWCNWRRPEPTRLEVVSWKGSK